MSTLEKNFWLTTVQAPEAPVRPLPASVDVAVIGAGFTGLSAARTLAKGGARVAVLEAENLGWGASCRNGGMVLSGLRLRIVEKKDLRSEIGSAIYHGGIVDEASAGVNPARYVAGLGCAAVKAGAEIHEK